MGNEAIQPDVKKFIADHRDEFERQLLMEAVTVNDKIGEILRIGNIDLINNAHKLVTYVSEGEQEKLSAFAKQEGVAWARHSLTLAFKLEWVSAIRRTMWDFIRLYIEEHAQGFTGAQFFDLEKKINSRLDIFLNEFFLRYSSYKDEQLSSQQALVEDLSVPIIPVTGTTSVLPLIGKLDYFRTTVIQEKVLFEISRLHIQRLILDMSGITEMEEEVIDNLGKVIDSTKMMGCEVIITGLRPDVVRKMAAIGRGFDSGTKTFGTLQQAIHLYL